MKLLETLATVEAGKLAIKQREKFALAIADLPDSDYNKAIEKLIKNRFTWKKKFGKTANPGELLNMSEFAKNAFRISLLRK